ncbi:MAG TPA: ABC transporter permease [Terriglobales bacterium]|nr:ABC transporter permease [Terriglobales bacterium]
MKTPDLVELAARNLRESILRNSLTTLGIAVGVASLVAMLSLGIGLQEMAGRRLAGSGLFDTIFVTSRQDFRGFDRDEDRMAKPEEFRALDDNARQEMRNLPGVVETFPEIRLMTEVRYEGKMNFAFVAALPPSARYNEAFEDMRGQFFSSPTAQEAILATEFARELTPDPDSLLGKEVIVRYAERQPLAGGGAASSGDDDAGESFGFSVVRREQPLKIVGLIEREPYSGLRTVSRGRIFIPTAFAESLNVLQFSDLRGATRDNPARTYISLVVRVDSPSRVESVQNAIKKMGFRTFSVLDATKSLRRFFAIFDLFLGIFGSLALAVASLGIVNTLVMAILERRREIGILKALGASDGDVKTLFFVEAGVMGAFGGALGVVLGWAIGRLINWGANVYLARQQLPPEQIWSVPWWLVLAALAFAVLVSLISGLYPAARAARLDPVQALRYE